MARQVVVYNKDNLPTADIDKFVDLQRNLKNMTVKNFEKLKNSILTYGFSFPLFVWNDEGTLYTVDGHHRIKVLQELRFDGCLVPELPYCSIEAKNKTEAKEKLLMFNSRFAKVTDEGLYEFVEKANLDLKSFMEKIEFPEINSKVFVESYCRETPSNKKDKKDGPVINLHKCPECGHEF